MHMNGADEDIIDREHGEVVLPFLVNAHTHCADAGAKAEPGMTLEQLVAPPDGLKHRYLRETPRDTIIGDIRRYSEESASNGISAFADFREGGADGCRMLSEASESAFILGRPVSPSFDSAELDEILSVADGIALSAVSDMDRGYIEKCADAAHKAGKPFAIHLSERIREDAEFVLSLGPAFVVHMVNATDSDIRLFADAGIPIAVCPRSNAFFGLVPPVDRMLDLGATVALGTDNAMLCTPDLRPEARLASEILSSRGHDPLSVFNILADGSAAMAEALGIRPGPEVRLSFYDGDPLTALL